MGDDKRNGQWANRIVGMGEKPADQFMANPSNARQHPQNQRDAVRGSLNELGWVAPVVENVTTGYLLDGHERVWQALDNDNADVPFIQVDLSPEEEKLFLASFDYITTMAYYDADILDGLLRDVQTGEAALQQMLSEMAEKSGIALPDGETWEDAFGALPEGDRAPFQQMTFTLHDTQAEKVKEALGAAKALGPFDTPNENSNGNALARVCETFLTDYGQG